MALIIPNYKSPGSYSTIIPNPTTTSASGPPVVAIIGQGLRGPYEPQLFFNSDDAQLIYGVATKSNPLPLGIQIAFENGAPRVLGVNVQPTNSSVAYLKSGALPGITVATAGSVTSLFPTAPFAPAATGSTPLLDPVTNQPVNVDGTVAGVFYVQDFDPNVADPVLNSTPQATANAFGLSANGNLLQYIKNGIAPTLNGVQQVPLSNGNMIRVTVPAVQQMAIPATGTYQSALLGTVTQNEWNQLQNALALINAINSTPNSPIFAQILLPDSLPAASSNPVPGYTDLFSAVTAKTGFTVGAQMGTIQNTTDAYVYACMAGIFRISAIEPGVQHEIVMGLFAASTFDISGTKPFGLPTPFAGTGTTNPYIIFNNGNDGVITTQSYIDAINNELTTVRADIIVVLNSDSTLQGTIKSHVTEMSSHDERNERIAFVSGPISELYSTSMANAQALQGGPGAQRMVYVWPPGGYRQDAVLRTQVTLDGTYLGAACAGELASNNASEPLTRKQLAGFTDVITKTTRTQMNMIAQSGICVIENNPTQGLRVRDGLTCDPSTAETQEISVVRQLDFTVQTVRDLLDLNVVAKKITQNTLAAVQVLTKNALQNLVDQGVIFGFQNVTVRISPLDPRQIDVRFTVRPAYPCKYIEITLSVTSALDGF
jgi:hypothetical protein